MNATVFLRVEKNWPWGLHRGSSRASRMAPRLASSIEEEAKRGGGWGSSWIIERVRWGLYTGVWFWRFLSSCFFGFEVFFVVWTWGISGIGGCGANVS